MHKILWNFTISWILQQQQLLYNNVFFCNVTVDILLDFDPILDPETDKILDYLDYLDYPISCYLLNC